LPYDPVKRHMAIEKIVTRTCKYGQEKRYYRIRLARWYGGIVTADCVGCGLLCRFCWVSDKIMHHPHSFGKFYSSAKIAESMVHLAKKRSLELLRVSGGEPTIGKTHLLGLLENLKGMGYRFILETNGILIAHDEKYAESLARYDYVHVRVSLKGCNEAEFAMLTGAIPEGFRLQLKALKNLVDAGVSCHPSVMASFSTKKSLNSLVMRISEISQSLAEEIEVEELILYPHVARRLKVHGLKIYRAYTPNKVPPEQV
jgi:uncharacterized Fe-S cluster-containing radical SAM superfamily protein